MQAGAVKEERIYPLSRGLRVGAGKGAATWSLVSQLVSQSHVAEGLRVFYEEEISRCDQQNLETSVTESQFQGAS